MRGVRQARTQPPLKLFALACDLGMALGWENIAFDAGCKEIQVDGDWWMAINGHGQATPCSRGARVPGFHIYFEWKGLPAGVVGWGGGLVVCSRPVNEETLIAALEAAIERVGQTQ